MKNSTRHTDTITEIKMQDFIFNWEGGGFNTVWAETVEDAKVKIMEQWGDHGSLKPRLDTVKAISQKSLNSWYRMYD